MKAFNTIATMLLHKARSRKISKQRLDLLLSTLAIAALSDKVAAASQDGAPAKSYRIDIAKLAEEAGIEVVDVENLLLSLADGDTGQLISLGGGIYLFIPATAGAETDLVISDPGVGQTVMTVSFRDSADISTQHTGFDMASLDPGQYVSNFLQLATAELADKPAHKPGYKADEHGPGADQPDAANVTVNVEMSGMGLGLVVLALAASGSSSASEVLQTLAGVISHGTLQNAQVFLDANSDGTLDWTDANSNDTWDAGEGEQWTLSGADGTYSLAGVSAADIASGTLVGQAYN